MKKIKQTKRKANWWRKLELALGKLFGGREISSIVATLLFFIAVIIGFLLFFELAGQ